jgi:hypothetical protein
MCCLWLSLIASVCCSQRGTLDAEVRDLVTLEIRLQMRKVDCLPLSPEVGEMICELRWITVQRTYDQGDLKLLSHLDSVERKMAQVIQGLTPNEYRLFNKRLSGLSNDQRDRR